MIGCTGFGDPETDYDAKILGPANQAINLAPDDPRSYFPKAQYLGLSRRPSEALDAANAGLAINPNDVGLVIARAIAENSLGQYEQAKADMARAIRLSPRDRYVGIFHIDLAEAEIGLGHFDAAIDELRKAIDLGQGRFTPTRTWRLPTRMREEWTRRRRPWPKPAASIQQSRSNG